jgi:rRNA pseudouridine-1189 N-methylase Emg1 (Nep1/Mra1 family)
MVFPRDFWRFIPFMIKLLKLMFEFFGDAEDLDEMNKNGFS